MADSACSQALWQAVMGVNPSHFLGDDRCPVEEVSWSDVQDLLQKLKSQVPGCAAALPTEAEWEYACRAGTESAFSFGDQVSPEQVNYNGNKPYASGAKGLYRERTVPVKSLPSNPWGLYECHGNVWEWCEDGQRKFDAAARRDPSGPVANWNGLRVALRGGSLRAKATRARSARRETDHTDIGYLDVGFRLCMRPFLPDSLQGSEVQNPQDERDRPGLLATQTDSSGLALDTTSPTADVERPRR
jgi:formylglycine-generating enzyme required for sulfatase activity